MSDLPTIDELSLGAFLHDAGKLLQRGMGTIGTLPEAVRELESELCPVWQHRYSHKHVLFTELLFHDLTEARLALPAGLDRDRVRVAAVYHHRPDSTRAWTNLVAEADRLSSGMDRKEKDRDREVGDELQGWDAFRTQPLQSVLSRVRLPDRSEPRALWLRPVEATPDTIIGAAGIDRDLLLADYARTAEAFRSAFLDLCRDLRQPADILHEGATALAERFWWAVPSSTTDEPDVPLFDHSLSVAAFAACLHAHHAPRDELSNEAAIRDRTRPKFRLLRGDLSGIQATLFRLAAQQVKGVNRILRARSFLMSQLVDAAAILIRRAFGLPPYVALLRAGGQLTLLLPEVENVTERVAELQAQIDAWMAKTYAGELALVLGLTGPLAGEDFMRGRIERTIDALRLATEEAKQRALVGFLADDGPVLGMDYEEGAEGACPTCGVRPARMTSTLDGVRRCPICHYEHDIGQDLPRLSQCALLNGTGDGLQLFDELRLVVRTGTRPLEPGRNVLSAWKPRGSEIAWPVTDRWLANYVPTFEVDPGQDPRYRDIEQDEKVGVGSVVTMSHLAASARDVLDGVRVVGRAMLGVLKADVDNLGQLFAFGLGADCSIGRLVALSRSIDAFFTGRLPQMLRQRYPATYIVYAGGDDLLLIGPWHRMLALAGQLRAEFGQYCGGNPSMTLSAGIELVSSREPLNRSADRAEALLERAKSLAGKDRIACLGEVLDWSDELPWLLHHGEELCARLRREELPTAFAYQLMHFADEKARADAGDTRSAIWRARYSYALARRWPKRDEFACEAPFFHGLLGLMGDGAKADRRPPTRAALSIALWRNR